LDDVRRICDDHHAVGADCRARRLQLRHLLDLDDADTARSVDAEAWVVAVVRHLVAVLDCGFEHGLALLDCDLASVYRQRDGFHTLEIIPYRFRGSGVPRFRSSLAVTLALQTVCCELRNPGTPELLPTKRCGNQVVLRVDLPHRPRELNSVVGDRLGNGNRDLLRPAVG